MSKIIQRKHTVGEHLYEVFFEFTDMTGAGYAFPANKHYEVQLQGMSPEGLENYRKCLNGTYPVHKPRNRTRTRTYNEPAVLLCDCGKTVSLGRFTNSCHCGRDYNSSGQLLAHRSQWGEETGETIGEILRIP